MTVVIVTGTNASAAGQPGDPAVATAANATDASNTATATGGNGANAVAFGGGGGQGGNARASATTTLFSTGATSATASAGGGAGGIGQLPTGGPGAAGGDAIATAIDTGAADCSATAVASGGASGGDSGFASMASGSTAYASGTNKAFASVAQTGGSVGPGRYTAVPGQSSSLTNAAGGQTNHGILTLDQTAIGGNGNITTFFGGGPGGKGGDATSSLTFDDTRNSTQSASITVDVAAIGGAGGPSPRLGGSGGDSNSTALLTGTGPTTANVSATGGNGSNGGTGGSAIAVGSVTTTSGVATATVSAKGGDSRNPQASYGPSGAASATSMAAGTNVLSSATAQGGQGSSLGYGAAYALAGGLGAAGLVSAVASSALFLSGNSVLETDSASATSTASGASTSEAASSFGGAPIAFVTDKQAVAHVVCAPDASSVNAITSSNSYLAASFATSPVYLGIAELGGATTSIYTAVQTITDHVKFTMASNDSTQNLVLGFFGATAKGAGFGTLNLTLSLNGIAAFSRSFSSFSSLNNYFANNAVAASSLVGAGSMFNVDIGLSMTFTSAGSGFDFGVLIGTASQSPPARITVAQFLANQPSLDGVGNICISDTAATVAASLGALNADANVASITLSDSATLTLSAAQAVGNARALGVVKPATIIISDTSSNLYANYAAISALTASGLVASWVMSGVTGKPYTSQTVTFDGSGRVTAQRQTAADGSVYYNDLPVYNADGTQTHTSTGSIFGGLTHVYTFNASARVIEDKVTGYAGLPYASTDQFFDASGRLTENKLLAADGSTYYDDKIVYNADGSQTDTRSGSLYGPLTVTTTGPAFLSGTPGPDAIYGGAGADTLTGGDELTMTSAQKSIYRLYGATLNRAPDLPGLNGWVGFLAGGMSLVNITAGFVNSAEFQVTYGPLDNTQFVTLLYKNVLQRLPDSGGLNYWLGQLNGIQSRSQVVNGFSDSPEYQGNTELATRAYATTVLNAETYGKVFRLYGATLGRGPDPGGFEYWVNQLAGGTALGTATAGFVGSPEFTAAYGALDNTAFITLLYRNVLGRAPDVTGFSYWQGQLSGGATRSSVVNGFSESPEYQGNTAAPLRTFMQTGMTPWMDTLNGGSGDDVLFGGRGADTFQFDKNFAGNDTVLGFENWDTLNLTNFGYANAAAATSHMTQSGADVVFADQGETIMFKNAALATVTGANYTFA